MRSWPVHALSDLTLPDDGVDFVDRRLGYSRGWPHRPIGPFFMQPVAVQSASPPWERTSSDAEIPQQGRRHPAVRTVMHDGPSAGAD